jgi:hypothetical protein
MTIETAKRVIDGRLILLAAAYQPPGRALSRQNGNTGASKAPALRVELLSCRRFSMQNRGKSPRLSATTCRRTIAETPGCNASGERGHSWITVTTSEPIEASLAAHTPHSAPLNKRVLGKCK